MTKIITVSVQKGGAGKTTTVHELASHLHFLGHKVLCIDLDQQSNLSRISGAALSGYYTIYDVLKGMCKIEDSIQEMNNYHISIAHAKLDDAEKEFNNLEDVYLLVDALKDLKKKGTYDYIIIDTPPNLKILPLMALTSADYVLIPVEATSSGIQGLSQMFSKIDVIRHPERGTNKNLKIAGMLLTRFKQLTLFQKSIRKQLVNMYDAKNIKVYETYIREGVSIQEAQAWQQSILEYAPKSKPAKDYADFTQEFLKEIN